jgi:methionyl-tRNA synthetase
MPERMVVHGYLLMDGEKMSKSLGNVLDPFEVIDRFGADALRFYLLREVQFGADGSVSTAGFESRYSTELANDFGNLASRTIAMVSRWREGRVASVDHDPAIVVELGPMAAEVAELLDEVELTQALEAVWVRIRRLNRYVEETAPWNLAKDIAKVDRLDQVLATLIEGVRCVSVALHSFIPDSTTKLLAALGRPELGWDAATFAASGSGGQVEPIEPLFPKP